MAITTTQVTQLADSVAQAISDFNTNFVTGTSSSATTINTGVGGTGVSQTYGRVLNLLDSASELALLSKTNTVAAQVAADITGRRSLTAFYSNYFPLLDALDNLVGGLSTYLTTNSSIQVNAYFAAAFNAYVSNSVIQGLRTSATVPTALSVANYFPFAAIDNMWNFTPSGATTFSTNAVGANASTSVSGGGTGTFYIYRSGSTGTATTPASQAFTISYTNAAGTTASTTYTTTSNVPPASGSLSAGFTLGVTGSAITGVTGTGMDPSSQWVIGMKLVRSAGY